MFDDTDVHMNLCAVCRMLGMYALRNSRC